MGRVTVTVPDELERRAERLALSASELVRLIVNYWLSLPDGEADLIIGRQLAEEFPHKSEILKTLEGYRLADEYVKREQAERLRNMTDEEAVRIFKDLCRTWEIMGGDADLEELRRDDLEALLRQREVFRLAYLKMYGEGDNEMAGDEPTD